MIDTKTYHKFLNKIKRSLQRKYNVGLSIEFNGYESSFSLNENKDIVFSEIPVFLIDIRTNDNVYSTDILDSLKVIQSSFGGSLSFRYKINGNHFFPLKNPDFINNHF